MAAYNHREVEARWQQYWADNNTFLTPEDRQKPKYYLLDMFPYPSGSGLHVGHPKGYVATDVVARAKRMMGYNVLRVMGWDAFGLPTERQAVREGKHPAEITRRNIATFKAQLSQLGLSYDWTREISTAAPQYYKWTQWIFCQLYEKGLAYEAEVPVNWCTALGTVLANEEVKDGVYVETGDPVERRSMKQWMLRITDYADQLLDGLEAVDWPEGIKDQQRHWIGRSRGAEIRFELDRENISIDVFSTRPDTLFGCTYLVLAPEHPLLARIVTDERRQALHEYCAAAASRSERDRISGTPEPAKAGIFTGAYAKNPANGELVPVWVADYVLASYGTGAVFACPAHDERDYAFARLFALPIRAVIEGGDIREAAYTGDGPHIASGFLDGSFNQEACEAIVAWLERAGTGKRVVRYRLRDWLFSRQRYWGEPIPAVELADGTTQLVSQDQLPVTLPELEDYRPTPDGLPPLARAKHWLQYSDTKSGMVGQRETNTMPQWAGSCWYYLRFLSPELESAAWAPVEEKYWMPVDLYVGGSEHATLHLLYARFWHRVLFELGYVHSPEPFQRLVCQGMVHATSYRDARGKYYYAHEIEQRDGAHFVRGTGVPVSTRLEKMSKSKNNVVNPDDICREWGADALRLYELFMGPLDEGIEWETTGVAGTRRFLDRVWRLVVDPESGGDSGKITDRQVENPALERALHSAIKRVTESVETLRFNVAIAEMMMLVNEATKAAAIRREWIEPSILILSPFAPHLAEELWQRLGHSQSLSGERWPVYDEAKLVSAAVTVSVQVNGRMRGTIEVPLDAEQDTVMAVAKADERIAKHLKDKMVKKCIYVPNRMLNIITAP